MQVRIALAAAIALATTSVATPAAAFLDEDAAEARRRAVAQDESDDGLPARVGLEALGWLVGGFVMFGTTAALFIDSEEFGPPFLILSLLAAPPAGVSIAGSLLDGQGSYWWSFLGGLVGWIPAIAVIAHADDGDYSAGDQAVAIATAFAFPMVGAIFGYEITNEPEEPEDDDD